VVEVLSPSTRAIDSGVKLTDYFRLPSLTHYLVVNIDARAVTHHRRDEAGNIATQIVRNGTLALDPPGIALKAEDFFATL
jgi:Uma2 family endonuclease